MSCVCAPVNTVPWSAFTDQVRTHVHTAPDDIMEQAVRTAVIEMSQAVMNIQRDVYIDVQEGVQDYHFQLADCYVPHMVRSVCYEGCDLQPNTSPDCHNHPGTFYYEPPYDLLIGSCPREDKAQALVVRVVVQPGPDSCEVDRWVYDRHSEAVANGALSRLLLMKDADWFDITVAGIMMRRWKTALNRMKGAQAKNRVSGPTFMKTRRFV